MTASSSLLDRKRREAIEEIVDTAIDLFERDGFDATSVEAIAAAAGCSPRTFYRYFGTKEDVLFHDIPDVIERLAGVLAGNLERGLPLWEAVSGAVNEILGRFEPDEASRPVRRMELWRHEPALRARYMQHLGAAEGALVEVLSRHRGTDPGDDDLAQLIAIAAIGAYRTTVTTHEAGRSPRELTEHLGRLLGVYGKGLERS